MNVRMERPMLAQLDAWRAAQPDQPARPEAVRRLLAERLPEAGVPLANIADQIEAQKDKIEALPPPNQERSPEAGMNTMRRAVAESELHEMQEVRRRAKKA